MNDRHFLEQYFSTDWLQGNRSLAQYRHSGYALVHKVHPDERVLDVGCGTNPFKNLIPNLHGIDITNVGCDEVIAIEDFVTEDKYDVAFCLGSINFGDIDTIRKQIAAVDKALTPNGRIYWRCNPGLKDHKNDKVEQIDFFPWSFDYHVKLSIEFGYSLHTFRHDGENHNRLYAEWLKI